MNKSELKVQLDSMKKEYEDEFQDEFPVDIFKEVLAEDIKSQMRQFVKRRVDFLKIHEQIDLLHMIDEKDDGKETDLDKEQAEESGQS